MAKLLHHALFWTLPCVFLLLSAYSRCYCYNTGINTTAGQNVNLTCRAPNTNNIIVVEWSRADLESEYVILYQDGHFVPDEQHPSFKNRVDLQDRQMKDGDVSLILKNVTINDTGTYECRILMSGTNRKNTKPTSTIYLSVDPPGQTGGHSENGGKEDGVSIRHHGLIAVVIFYAVPVAAIVVFFIYRTHQHQNQDSNQPPTLQQPV